MLIKLQYFKNTTGKFYTAGEYRSEKSFMFEVTEEVKTMRGKNELPGILGGKDYFIHIEPVGDAGFPCLLLPEQ